MVPVISRWERCGQTMKEWGTHADGDQSDSLVDPSKRRHIDGLTTDGTLRTDTGRVLTWTSVDNGVDEDLSPMPEQRQLPRSELRGG